MGALSYKAVQHFEANLLGDDYVVGDVHGCFEKLQVALEEINFNDKVDRLFIVGDLVDRGPNSEDSLDWLAQPWVFSVRGNHEQMAIDYCEGYSDDYYAYNGGQWMMNLHDSHAQLFAEAFRKLPIAIDVKGKDGKLYGIIHAECPVNDWGDLEAALTGHNKAAYEGMAMWQRSRYNNRHNSVIKGVEKIYVGHTLVKEPLLLGNVHYIDTGACQGGKFTIMKIGE